jgi:predicted nucleotidyltransferase
MHIRKNKAIKKITDVQDQLLSVKKYLEDLYGKKIKRVIVYGSFARGDATEDSDIDLMVVVDDMNNPREVEKSLNGLLFDILLDKGELISVMAIPESIFYGYNSPFLHNVREEGVSL